MNPDQIGSQDEQEVSEGAAAIPPGVGPFEPPPDYEFEPELLGDAPREVPPESKHGPFAKKRLAAILGVLTAASLCVGSSRFSLMREWGQYFLPLAWLFWIGLGLVAIAAIMGISNKLSKGPFRYVEEGIPLVGRILALVKRPALIVNGAPSQYDIITVVDYRDPATNELKVAELKSPPFSAAMKDKYGTSFRVGDYVTLAYFPGKFEKTVQVYGYLGLRDNEGLIRVDDPDAGRVNLWKIPLTVLAVAAIFGVLGWNLYAFGRFFPVDFEVAQGAWPMGIGGLVLGSALIGFILWEGRRGRANIEKRNALAVQEGNVVEADFGTFQGGLHGWIMGIVLIAGSLLLGGATFLCWCFTWNALADNSPPQMKPVQINDMIMTTHNFIFREYTLEYTLEGAKEKQKLMTSPAHLRDLILAGGQNGMAEIHAGRLGWPWVKTVHPVAVADPDNEINDARPQPQTPDGGNHEELVK